MLKTFGTPYTYIDGCSNCSIIQSPLGCWLEHGSSEALSNKKDVKEPNDFVCQSFKTTFMLNVPSANHCAGLSNSKANMNACRGSHFYCPITVSTWQ
jgi:hypothetical protein